MDVAFSGGKVAKVGPKLEGDAKTDVRDVSGKDLRLVGLVDGAEGSFDLLECAQLPRESLGNQRLIDSFVHETPRWR